MSSIFLDVEKSLSNRQWIGPSIENERLASGLVQKHNISQLTALLLAKRGILSNDITSFLSPKIKNLMPDPYILKDMRKGSERFLDAIKNNEKICIFADYDVDGTASASILFLWLEHFKILPQIYIPDRINEGYGPNLPAIDKLSKNNKLIICVDCGTVAHDAIQLANKNGADVIIIDHHIADEVLPPALAIINPKRQDETSKLDYLCAAGVVFLFLVSVTRLLRKRDTNTPEIMNFLDLVGLATVADVVPLVQLNRAFVTQGLKILAKRCRPGLVALIDEANIRTQPTSYHLGFLLAPRINAAGRLADATMAVDLFTTSSDIKALEIARELNEFNLQRRIFENEVYNEALAQIELQQKKGNDSVIWVVRPHWHPGVIGIVASKLTEKFNVPSFVFCVNDKGLAIGSARSVPGVDIGSEVKKLLEAGLIEAGGGHSMAAGIKSTQTQLEPAMETLKASLKHSRPKEVLTRLEIDSLISIAGANIEIVEEINSIGPFGADNPSPLIAIANCQIKYTKILTNKHIKFLCIDTSGKKLESIYFNGVETNAGQKLLKNVGETFHLCGKLEINDWGGYRRVILQIKDVALV